MRFDYATDIQAMQAARKKLELPLEKTCPYCGRYKNPEFKVCFKCGPNALKKIEEKAPDKVSPEDLICPNCGENKRPHFKVCFQCHITTEKSYKKL